MLDSFGIGLAMAVARRRFPPRLSSGMRVGLIAASCLALSALALTTESIVQGRLWSTPWLALGLHSWAALAAAALVWAVHDLGPSERMRRAWTWAGQLSYGIYLWHAIVLFLLLAHSPLRGTALLLSTLVPTLLLAAAGWLWLERPILDRAGAHPRPETNAPR
jgi:peptidoglycan/LPS O-acetylase OafA/YrhL